ncbi:Redox-sensitive transcriptional regulator (AT-rich DNA-binding protein) [Dehalobacter sp. UNSWDHB]|jgi:redox-sensing transcriptional repressor|uniref:Redox-sensing transcriptional repressor Rex n=1 Tax=Dehalobacter restrictus TaxID=55583 RepID=A0A857DKZ6_9FIRM|nr:Redox-sensitive transcriptional regulator (AT-rich DNA-binding protein) [Dehalobacter sp. DCA]AFV06623.1 Redox-sensitive transcriptional regulator (AT-rich DNA-binding protein) [Dehalobacter sp. CF]EQB20335.1 Redox-sensitive transcriptional regulator (AT-rich DNA-binding protein) [Dehalobacter sp. UNSWDHB]OCZ52158.1 redox-sensing transcriptional repressor Rex [Dehalobacter sp. TeCB1]QHA01483.1 redox-sensing transcriptional repressor Rex [Dehalobacter restrictus]
MGDLDLKTLKIPEATIIRLSVYSRYLTEIDRKGIITISSGDIAEGVGVSPAQVRKDLAYFGEFGIRGVGYNVKDLHKNILRIMGLSNEWSVCLVGLGNLGLALSTYKGFKERGFSIINIFDNDPQKTGMKINDIEVLPIETMEEVVAQNQIQIGAITVPASAAQEIADKLIKGGVQAILNFAPVVLNVPPTVELRNVDLSVNLEVLTFNLGGKMA